MNINLMQDVLETGKAVLSYEGITIQGILLGIIIMLLIYIKQLRNDNKLMAEKIEGFIEKYYTISTMISERLEK